MPDQTSVTLTPATAVDAEEVAALHAASWRATYRGVFDDAFLDAEALDNRRAIWARRLDPAFPSRKLVLLARDGDGTLLGFVCVLPDEEPEAGVLLDNLHVAPDRKGHGVGRRLFDAARAWAAAEVSGAPLFLYVFEKNTGAIAFYDRIGGTVVARRVTKLRAAPGATELRYQWPPLLTAP